MGNLRKKDLFIYGKIGSGKDILSNKIISKFPFHLLFRLSGTIKQIIMEQKNLTFDELEELKRTDSEIRNLHHTIGDYIGGDITANNRLKQLINRTSFDMKNISDVKWCPIIINDIRTKENILTLFETINSDKYLKFREEYSYDKPSIIFLTRESEEYQNKIKSNFHYTDEDCMKLPLFSQILKPYLQKEFEDNFDIYLIDNADITDFDDKDLWTVLSLQHKNFHFLTNVSVKTKANSIINNIFRI